MAAPPPEQSTPNSQKRVMQAPVPVPPLPSHTPKQPEGRSSHSSSGSVLTGMAEQAPSRLQASQVPSHSELQHTSSTQKPVAQKSKGSSAQKTPFSQFTSLQAPAPSHTLSLQPEPSVGKHPGAWAASNPVVIKLQ
jgi:hypothetical protein